MKLNAEQLCDAVTDLARASGLGFANRKQIKVTVERDTIVLTAKNGDATHVQRIKVDK